MQAQSSPAVSRDAVFWEPHTFKLGDHVRVRVSPECPEPGRLDPTNPEEWGWLSRDTGVIVAVADDRHRALFPQGHWYGVEMDDNRDLLAQIGVDVAARTDIAPSDWYAAVELDLIGGADARA